MQQTSNQKAKENTVADSQSK